VYLGLGDPSYEALLPKKMFRNRSGQYFEDVTTSGGFGNLQKGHGIAFADLENNGNEDVLEEMGGAFPGDSYVPAIYRNPGHGNHWLELTLQGVRSNRAAFGARVKVTIDDAGHRRSIYRAVGSVSSFGGNPLRQHIGIGKATAVRELEVWWPASGTRQLFKNLDVDRMYRVREGAEAPETLALTSFEFGKSRIAHHEHDLQH